MVAWRPARGSKTIVGPVRLAIHAKSFRRHLRELQDASSISIFRYAQLGFGKKGVMDTVACRSTVMATYRCWMRESWELIVCNTSHHIDSCWIRSIEDANGFRIPF